MSEIVQAVGFPVDPLVRALTQSKIDFDVQEYLRLLDTEAPEQAIHDFLTAHTYFFNGVVRLRGFSPLYSKVRLGTEYEVDFVCFDSGSVGPEWCLVEIESPSKKMFTQKGDPTAALTHAIRQVRDWHAWIHENLDYARKLLPNIEYPLSYVFIGRRNHLTPDTKRKLRRLVHDHRMFLRIHTLDWLASAALDVKDLVHGDNGGSWFVPMRAFSHSDLVAGQPKITWEWLLNPGVMSGKKRDSKYLLNERMSEQILDFEYRKGGENC